MRTRDSDHPWSLIAGRMMWITSLVTLLSGARWWVIVLTVWAAAWLSQRGAE